MWRRWRLLATLLQTVHNRLCYRCDQHLDTSSYEWHNNTTPNSHFITRGNPPLSKQRFVVHACTSVTVSVLSHLVSCRDEPSCPPASAEWLSDSPLLADWRLYCAEVRYGRRSTPLRAFPLMPRLQHFGRYWRECGRVGHRLVYSWMVWIGLVVMTVTPFYNSFTVFIIDQLMLFLSNYDLSISIYLYLSRKHR